MKTWLTILEQIWRVMTVICALRGAAEAFYNVGQVANLMNDLDQRIARIEESVTAGETQHSFSQNG